MVVLIIWSWIIFFGIGVVTALAESLASLDPSSIPFPTVWQPKMYPDIIKCSPGSETVWVENYIKGMVYVYKISVVFRLLFLNSLIWRSDTGMLEWIRSLLLSLPTALREHWQGNTDGGSCILSLWCSYSAVDSGGIITIHRNFRVGALFLELKSSVWHKSLILKKMSFFCWYKLCISREDPLKIDAYLNICLPLCLSLCSYFTQNALSWLYWRFLC